MIGKAISHYQIIEKLGEGGMSQVYKAEDLKLNRIVALKFSSLHLTSTEDDKKRFIREARAGAALNHPNICPVYEIGEIEGQPFIVMPYLEGSNLKEKIKIAPLPLNEVLEIAIQIAQGLNEAHRKNVVHRDIKSANITITTKGQAVIMDFGLSWYPGSSSVTKDGTTLGTISYMSPEQARGTNVDHRTDIWSFGVTLYEMITGELPFKGHHPQAVIYSILNSEPEPVTQLRKEVPIEFELIINKALAKEPLERFQQIIEMENDLKALEEQLATGIKKTLTAETAPPQRITKRSYKNNLEDFLSELGSKSAKLVLDNLIYHQTVKHAVGRKPELSKLHASFNSVRDGHGQLLCVTGEAGLGKTTLIEKFFSELATKNHECIIGRGRSSERLACSEGYLPIFEAIEGLLKSQVGYSFRKILKQVAPTWYVEVVPPSEDEPSDTSIRLEARLTSQERMKREFGTLLREISKIRPFILFFDDLHWADVSTIDMLSYVGNQCENLSLLILVGYRPTELLLSQNQFEQVKLGLQTRKVCKEISLDFLSREELEDYLELKFAGHNFPPEFIELCYQKTEGSPLFMVDLLNSLHESEVIKKQNNRWIITRRVSEVEDKLPDSIRSMIQRKINRLEKLDHQLLEVASIQGHEFDSAVLAKVFEIEESLVEERLQFLDNVHSFIRIVREQEFPDMTPTLHYEFVHILYQNAFYETLRLTQKSKLSNVVAETLLNFYKEKENEIAADLGYLFEAGRDYQRATDYFIMASEKASQIFAFSEAKLLLERAIKNSERLEGNEKTTRVFTAAMQLGELDLTTGAWDKSITEFKLAEKVAREEDNIAGIIFSHCALANGFVSNKELAKGRKYGQKALESANSINFDIGAASAESVLALERCCIGELDEAIQYFDRAIPVLREKGSPIEAILGISFRGFIHEWRLEYDKLNQVCSWALDQSKEIGSALGIFQNLWTLGMGYGNYGHMSKALDTLFEVQKLLELVDDQSGLRRVPNSLGWLYSELQDFESALYWNKLSLDYCQKEPEAEPEANTKVNLARDYLTLGELELAFENLKSATKLFEEDIWFRWRYNIRLHLEWGRYWIARDDLKLANHHANISLQEAERTLSRKYVVWGNNLLGDIALLEDKLEDAQNHFNIAFNILNHYPCPIVERRLLNSAIDLAKKMKDGHKSEQLFSRKQAVIKSLADSIYEKKLRKTFLSSRNV